MGTYVVNTHTTLVAVHGGRRAHNSTVVAFHHSNVTVACDKQKQH